MVTALTVFPLFRIRVVVVAAVGVVWREAAFVIVVGRRSRRDRLRLGLPLRRKYPAQNVLIFVGRTRSAGEADPGRAAFGWADRTHVKLHARREQVVAIQDHVEAG